ncbi:MAG: isoprenylcysteine carboxylmethyltransferase family protein [Acidimicrobiales bacterium]
MARPRIAPVSAARAYFAAQALCGAAWWIAVFASTHVRWWTLGRWDPAVLVVPDALLFVGASAVAAARTTRVAATVVTVWSILVTIALAVTGLVDRVAGWGVVLMTTATVCSAAATATIRLGHIPTGWFFVGPFSFRPADDASGARHLRRSLSQLVVFWTTFFVVVPLVLGAIESRLRLRSPLLDHTAVRVAGIVLFAAGSAVGLWACVTMALRGRGTPLPAATARELVVAGPYRWVRNPMALAGVFQTIGVGCIVASWTVVVVAVAGAVVWNELIRPTEEADLAARFGASYDAYTQAVACWVPRRAALDRRALSRR